MIDLHCHLLPGVDDGPDTMEETVEYARAAARAGTERIVATPHVQLVHVPELPERVEEVAGTLADEGIELAVNCGGELRPDSVAELGDRELDVIAHGPPGRRWVLLEVPFRGLDEALVLAAEELRRRGFGALLAHPERASGFESTLGELRREVERGSAVQMNYGPLAGAESPEREQAARGLLASGLVSALATDAHPPGRPYTLDEGRTLAAAAGGDAARLVDDGPRRLLAEGLSL